NRQLGARVLAGELLDAPLEPLAVGHGPALRRSQRAELAGARAAERIGLALGPVDSRDGALDPHLAAERRPVEQERGVRIALQLVALAARVVREEDDPALVVALQQDHAD